MNGVTTSQHMRHTTPSERVKNIGKYRPNVLTNVFTPCHDSYMTTTKQREIWTTTTKSGQTRYWFFSNRAFRAFQMPRAEAELMLATEAAILTSKPEWVGR